MAHLLVIYFIHSIIQLNWMPLICQWHSCPQHDGKAAGDEENERTKEEISERKKREHDQLIVARIRGNEALKKEKLKHVSVIMCNNNHFYIALYPVKIYALMVLDIINIKIHLTIKN